MGARYVLLDVFGIGLCFQSRYSIPARYVFLYYVSLCSAAWRKLSLWLSLTLTSSTSPHSAPLSTQSQCSPSMLLLKFWQALCLRNLHADGPCSHGIEVRRFEDLSGLDGLNVVRVHAYGDENRNRRPVTIYSVLSGVFLSGGY